MSAEKWNVFQIDSHSSGLGTVPSLAIAYSCRRLSFPKIHRVHAYMNFLHHWLRLVSLSSTSRRTWATSFLWASSQIFSSLASSGDYLIRNRLGCHSVIFLVPSYVICKVMYWSVIAYVFAAWCWSLRSYDPGFHVPGFLLVLPFLSLHFTDSLSYS